MKFFKRINIALSYPLLSIFFIASCHSIAEKTSSVEVERPNILLVVADDLGMLDIGAFGSEIRTPTLDSLANSGVKLTDFHTSATCSPTRAMLLSGVNSHKAGMGNMIEHIAPNQRNQQGYEGHLSQNVVSVASLLKDSGYHTYMAGKWHLGKKKELLPSSRGFEETFTMLEGGASYFNDMMGLTNKVLKASYRKNGEVVEKLPENFYATESYADFIINKIKSNRKDDAPFFAYMAFSAPHWPLQVRDEHIDLYKNRYNEGYDKLFDDRITAAKKLGIYPENATSAIRPEHVKRWEDLSKEEQKEQARVMEIYAAVVERMDFQLGRIIDYLESNGELDNTLIVFLSDNGADGSDRSKLPGNATWLPEVWDLSYENMGKVGSYVYPDAGWARTSTGPSRMYKEFLSEGGIKSPAIISYPKIANRGSTIKEFISVMDITPTLLEFAGVSQPGNTYNGKSIHPLEGSSLKNFLSGDEATPHKENHVVGWELFGQKAIRQGDWKLLWLSSKPKWLVQPAGADKWGLYNLALDPGETNNLAMQNPEKLKQMQSLWKTYAKDNSVILPNWD
jgi:arylsulfatase